jgi:hypothetical protein
MRKKKKKKKIQGQGDSLPIKKNTEKEIHEYV